MFSSRFIDPTTDFGFKRLFGQEDSKEILKSFLVDILHLPHPIQELSYLPTEQLPAAPGDRMSVYDIYCIDTTGKRFIIEMQRNWQVNYKERSLYYSTFPISQQSEKDDAWAFELLPVYCISVMRFRMDNQPTYMRRVQLVDTDNGRVFYNKLVFVFIELPKFDLSADQLQIRRISGSICSKTCPHSKTFQRISQRNRSRRRSPSPNKQPCRPQSAGSTRRA